MGQKTWQEPFSHGWKSKLLLQELRLYRGYASCKSWDIQCRFNCHYPLAWQSLGFFVWWKGAWEWDWDGGIAPLLIREETPRLKACPPQFNPSRPGHSIIWILRQTSIDLFTSFSQVQIKFDSSFEIVRRKYNKVKSFIKMRVFRFLKYEIVYKRWIFISLL